MTGDRQIGNNLTTGEHIVLRNVLPEINIEKLKAVTAKLKDLEHRPIYIAKERLLGENTLKRYESAGVSIILERAAPWIKTIIGERWLILTNKVLLRRTWPMNEKKARELQHNASNLTWHQDSNIMHADKPMVVLMIPLQDGAGSICPGISILKSSTNRFEEIYGYEGHRVDEFEKKIYQRDKEFIVKNPILNSGDLLMFNGLTFHRTSSNQAMKSHRDALLIRIVRPIDAENFPKGDHLIIKTH